MGAYRLLCGIPKSGSNLYINNDLRNYMSQILGDGCGTDKNQPIFELAWPRMTATSLVFFFRVDFLS